MRPLLPFSASGIRTCSYRLSTCYYLQYALLGMRNGKILWKIIYISNYDIRYDVINVNGKLLRVLWHTNYFIECKFTESDVQRDSNYSSTKK